MTTSYPPLRSMPSVPIDPATALKHLQAYLLAAETNDYLLPNATLQPTGPVARGESLTMHNLRRVEAGLRGEWLAPELEMGDAEEGAGTEAVGGVGKKGEAQEDWVDLDEYQREQSIGDGEVDSEAEVVEAERLGIGGQGHVRVGKEMTKEDKKARKRAKMEKGKSERSAKEAATRAEGEKRKLETRDTEARMSSKKAKGGK